jgi:gluconolactonase
MVTEIPGVIAAGQKWTSIWKGTGNNADGMIAASDGSILVAQNTDSKVMKIDKDNQLSFPYTDTNTGGALSMNKKGALFMVSRGLPAKVLQLAPKRQVLADTYNGEPIDCIGGTINDLTADSKGGAYFTMGPFGAAGVFYASPKGVVTKYGENLDTNGLILSADEKTLYVTTRGIVAFDVQPDGSLKNQRQLVSNEPPPDATTGRPPGYDGMAIDDKGRIYVAVAFGGGGVQVISPEGKVLGVIPSPVNFVGVAFAGKDKKTLYGAANNQAYDEILTIDLIAQGYRGRAK